MRRIDWKLDSDESLEGRVFIYSKLVNHTGKEMHITVNGQDIIIQDSFIYATYNSTILRDIAIKRCAAPEDLESTVKEMEEIAAQWKKENNLPNIDENLHFYKIFLTVESEDAFQEFDDDVVCMGEYGSLKSCARAVDLGEDIYLIKLKEQQDKKKLGLQKKVEANKTYKYFIGRSIKDELLSKYVIPMIDAQHSGDKSAYSPIKARLLAFSEGSQFNADVKSLCELIEQGQTRPHLYAIQVHIEKIDAIHTEDYEKAASMRDEISRIIAAPPQES